MKSPTSITTRLTLTLAIASAVVFLAAGVAITAIQSAQLSRQQVHDLKTRSAIIESSLAHVGNPGIFRMMVEKVESFTPADDSLRYRISTPNSPYNYGPEWPTDSVRSPGPEGSYFVRFDDREFLAWDKLVPGMWNRPDTVLTVATDLAELNRTRQMMAIGVLVISIAGVIGISILARAAARRGLKPVGLLSKHAGTLNPADLSLRLPNDRLPPELVGLAGAFNGALDRLEEAYTRLATFNADVAHELRTPLANMIGQTQVALSRPRSGAEFEEVLQSNLEDLERLRGIISDMLFLARADQGAVAQNLVTTSLAGLVQKTADFMDLILEEQGVELVIEGDCDAPVEPALFGRAITNLIDNAVRHGARPGTVTVGIEAGAEAARISVRSPGPTIAPQDLARFFDRFYRSDPARFRIGDSNGLGLAIVKAIAEMHRGEVFARCDAGQVIVGFTIRQTPNPI